MIEVLWAAYLRRPKYRILRHEGGRHVVYEPQARGLLFWRSLGALYDIEVAKKRIAEHQDPCTPSVVWEGDRV